MSGSMFAPWKTAVHPIQDILQVQDGSAALTKTAIWRESKLSELAVVDITGALIASAITSAFSWDSVFHGPWTAIAVLYSGLIVSLFSVTAATQQGIALYRIGGHKQGLERILTRLGDPATRKPCFVSAYVWQIPIMLLNISILLFLIGISIIIWDRVASTDDWDENVKIAFVSSLAGILALANYVLGTLYLYQS